jgi:hypothetical protein
MNRQLGYSSLADIIDKYPAFFWNSVSMRLDGDSITSSTQIRFSVHTTCGCCKQRSFPGKRSTIANRLLLHRTQAA